MSWRPRVDWHRRRAAARRHDPVVPRRPRPTRGTTSRRPWPSTPAGGGPRPSGPTSGWPSHPAPRRGLAPVLPAPAGWRRPPSTPTSPPTSPPACGTTSWPPATTASCRRCGRSVEAAVGLRARPPDARGARCSGPATPTARRGRSPCSPRRRARSPACVRRRRRRAPRPRPARRGRRRPTGSGRVIADDPERLPAQGPLGHGLVLPGAGRRRSTGDAARARLAAGYDRFVIDGARRALRGRQGLGHRGRDGRVRHGPPGRRRGGDAPAGSSTGPATCATTTAAGSPGMVHPQRHHFPAGERTTYSAAAVTLAATALGRRRPAGPAFAVPDPRPEPGPRSRRPGAPGVATV